jgi:hypothetical protein
MGLAALHHRRGRPADAIPPLKDALTIDPDLPLAHIYLAQAFHLLGDHQTGLKEFAWQYSSQSKTWRSFEQPLWQGCDLKGLTILLWTRAGTGLGDTIMFLRYAAPLKDQGARVVVECRPELVSTAMATDGVDVALAQGVPLPPFDVHIPLPLVPTVLNSHRWPLPIRSRYISVDTDLLDLWRERLAPHVPGRLTVGLVWGGHPLRGDAAAKYIPLSAFAVLGDLTGIRFVSLQLGLYSHELLTPIPHLTVDSLLGERCSIRDTAALLRNLDLLISVDTMVAHLAGALAIPVWTILSRVADWRWFTGDTSPWYPTMRLFRQQHAGDWTEPIARIRASLSELLSERSGR